MSSTPIQGSQKAPYTPTLDHDVAIQLATTEYERVVTTLEQLTPGQWASATDCSAWDVRAIAGHVLGMAQMAASIRETMRQQLTAKRRAKRDGELMIDALTALQVEKNASLSPGEIVAKMRTYGPKAARGRARTPGFVRKQTAAQEVDGREEWWTIGFLMDTILTRDPFMHRIDIAHATGVLAPATAEHEGVIVDDVVREWARRHGGAYTLELTGPAGGTWSHDGGAGPISMDAFEFCRALSGRAPSQGLLSQQVPF
ncbi:maleylpyruvate isomerase family mycothiol-dependent enzyme [Nocardioides sp. InS609-2]|uniref:maleylpyruvate isomerase family mycothiol-dependent enzyme n=1 Tax=Nocardioides sp. InS609-2 TaxID=2760705 RepID=UPI0020C12C19|nr:maleylpyruvate isomerase family mycothiol-dependent enzyme [Nocardioides sp. InS609-2]